VSFVLVDAATLRPVTGKEWTRLHSKAEAEAEAEAEVTRGRRAAWLYLPGQASGRPATVR
jgi:hypothetical protein